MFVNIPNTIVVNGEIPIGKYKLKGKLVGADDDRSLPPQIYQKILNDLGLEYVEDYVSGKNAINSRFFMQVNSIIIDGKKKENI